MVWAAATGTRLEPESSFPFPLRIQQHSWSFVKGSGEWGKSSSPFMDSFLFPDLLTFCNFYQLQVLCYRQSMWLSEECWGAAFPAVLGSEEGCLDILSRNIFTQDSMAIWIFSLKNLILRQHTWCPSLRKVPFTQASQAWVLMTEKRYGFTWGVISKAWTVVLYSLIGK